MIWLELPLFCYHNFGLDTSKIALLDIDSDHRQHLVSSLNFGMDMFGPSRNHSTPVAAPFSFSLQENRIRIL